MRLRRFACAAAAALLLGAAPPAPEAVAESAQRVRAHVEFLSSDLLEGRDTGSRGLAVAAAYVAGQFQALGLRPGGPNGSWHQQVPFRHASHAGPPTVTYASNGRFHRLESGRDVGLRPSLTEQRRSIEAGLVFAGRGIADSGLGIDDYAGLDVRGKMVVVLSGAPPGIADEIASHLEEVKDEAAAARGAVGLIEIDAVRSQGPAWETRPAFDWVDSRGAAGSTAAAVRLNMALSEEWAGRLFDRASRSLAEIRAEARRSRSLRGFALPGRFNVEARSEWRDSVSPQVIALLPGADPALAAEHVVLMGHLDHLGIAEGARPGEDRIYNGAIDNAAGVATLIEAARAFADSGRPPRRSLLFIATVGEEHGLLGADYFAAHPTVPLDRLIGLVNLDMPLLYYPFTDVVAFGAERSNITAAVESAGRTMGVALSPDPSPEEMLFVRSDHYRFVTRGVPAVFLMTGHANGGAEAWKRFLGGIYHRPNDDVAQAIDWQSGARFAELNYRIARTLADSDARPRWYAGDYFGDRFAPAQPKAPR